MGHTKNPRASSQQIHDSTIVKQAKRKHVERVLGCISCKGSRNVLFTWTWVFIQSVTGVGANASNSRR